VTILRGEIIWITAEQLIAANARQVPNAFVRDRNSLESAVAAPVNLSLYEAQYDLVVLAVHLLHAVAMAHPFEDGNKRAAFFAAAAFLELNGAIFAPPDTEETAQWVTGLIEHGIDQKTLCELLRPFVLVL